MSASVNMTALPFHRDPLALLLRRNPHFCVCMRTHAWHDTGYPDDTGESRSSVMCVVTCEMCIYWETADLGVNTELTYKSTVVSFAHAIDFSICNCPVTLPGRGKFRLHLCTYCERVRTLCFSMRDSLRVQQKRPTVTASLMILYQSIRTCMGKNSDRGSRRSTFLQSLG